MSSALIKVYFLYFECTNIEYIYIGWSSCTSYNGSVQRSPTAKCTFDAFLAVCYRQVTIHCAGEILTLDIFLRSTRGEGKRFTRKPIFAMEVHASPLTPFLVDLISPLIGLIIFTFVHSSSLFVFVIYSSAKFCH